MTNPSPITSPTLDEAKPFLNEFLRFDNDSIFCFFDFETEGLNLFYSRVWQMACHLVKGETIFERQSNFVHWGDLKVSAEAARITGYNADKVKRLGWSPAKALDYLEERFRKADFIIGHNVIFFDSYIYKSWCRYLGRKPMNIKSKLLDTFLFAKAIKLGIPFKPDIDRYSFMMKLYSEIVKRLGCSLGVLAKDHGIVVDDSRLHDADYDLEINVHVWNRIKWSIPV